MSDFIDQFIADLVKGASHHLRENGGVGVNILVDRENHGREEKLANFGGMGGAAGSLIGSLGTNMPGVSPMGAAIGAAAGANEGRGVPAALGAAGGSLAGSTLGSGLGAGAASLLGFNPDLGILAGRALGGAAGGAVGGHLGGHDGRGLLERARDKMSSLEQRYTDGVKAASDALGIKEAFLPLLGSLLGGTALRAGVSRLAAGAGGKMLGGVAGKVAPHMASGIGGAATDMVGSMAGGALGSKLMPQRPQQPQGAVPPPPM